MNGEKNVSSAFLTLRSTPECPEVISVLRLLAYDFGLIDHFRQEWLKSAKDLLNH
jgi:hypothetical protein